MATANAHIGPWLEEVAHQRIHGTTGVRPSERLVEEQRLLLPVRPCSPAPPPSLRTGQVLPHESMQHGLSVYDRLLEGVA